MDDNNLSRADRGLRIHEALTVLFNESIKGKDTAGMVAMRRVYEEATADLVEATGVRTSLPSAVTSMTTDERAVVLAQSIRRAREFVMAQTRTNDFSIVIPKIRSKLKNLVDYCMYEHLATVSMADGSSLYFAISEQNQYVLCGAAYWEVPPVL